MLLFVVMGLCLSGVSVYVLLRLYMSLHSLEGLVLYVMVFRNCIISVCSSCWISSDNSLFNLFCLLMTSGVGNRCLRWFLVRILFLMYLWNTRL